MNEQEIRHIVDEEYTIVCSILSPNITWAHPFQDLQFIDAKAAYGKASSKGVLKISRVFLNTREYVQLRDTIRHEFAHMIVGNRHKHNPVWQDMARRVGAKPRATQRATGALQQTMKRKWRLMGITLSGETVKLHESHNRLGRYLAYRYSPQRFMSCSLGPIKSFYYERNK